MWFDSFNNVTTDESEEAKRRVIKKRLERIFEAEAVDLVDNLLKGEPNGTRKFEG